MRQGVGDCVTEVINKVDISKNGIDPSKLKANKVGYYKLPHCGKTVFNDSSI